MQKDLRRSARMIDWLGYSHYVFRTPLIVAFVLVIPTIVGIVAYFVCKSNFHKEVEKERAKFLAEHPNYIYDEPEWRYWRLPEWVKMLCWGLDEDRYILRSLLNWAARLAAITCVLISLLNPACEYSSYRKAKNYVDNKDTICREALIDHPTRQYVVDKEEEVAELKKNRFFTEEFKANPANFIDTERLWATLANNVHAKELEYFIMEDE